MRTENRHGLQVGLVGNGVGSRSAFATSIILAVVVAVIYLLGLIAAFDRTALPALGAGLVAGILAADLVTGLVHWTCDTWGGSQTTSLGGNLVRAFREHHRTPERMLDHDWVEVNGETALAALVAFLLLSPLALFCARAGYPSGYAFLWSFICFGATANQLHKWAHEQAPPRAVRTMQRFGLILSGDRHERHHRAPHTDNYCISTGWLNAPLDAIGFWRRLERLVEAVTGARARAEQEEV